MVELRRLQAENDILREKILQLEKEKTAMMTGKLEVIRSVCADLVYVCKAALGVYEKTSNEAMAIRNVIEMFNLKTHFDLKLE